MLLNEGGFSRVQKFEIQAYQGNQWKTIATGTSIGAYRKIEFPKPVRAQKYRLNIVEANEVPTITEFQLF